MNPRWYDYLNNKDHPNLLKYQQPQEHNLIICQQLKYRKFALFPNFLFFKRYQDQTSQEENCFYEVILGGTSRKIYFDIDVDQPEDFQEREFLSFFFEAIKKLVPKIQAKGSINVYTSHTEKKKSYHIVLAGYFLKNEGETLVFFNECKKLMPEKFQTFLDVSIYKKVQQFRILGSHKFAKQNTKVFREDLSYNFELPKKYLESEKAKENYLLSSSLIGNLLNEEYLENFKEPEKIKIVSNGFSSTGDLEDILKIFYSTYSESDFSYQNILDTNGNLIITFKRQRATFCEECKRYHEHENPYLTVTGIERNIYYYCRRREYGGKYLGSLGQFKLPDIKADEVVDLSKLNPIEKDTPTFSSIEHLENYTKKKKIKGESNFSLMKLKMYK